MLHTGPLRLNRPLSHIVDFISCALLFLCPRKYVSAGMNEAYWPLNGNWCVFGGGVLAEVKVERSGDQHEAVSWTPAGTSSDDLKGEKKARERQADRTFCIKVNLAETKPLQQKLNVSRHRRRWSQNTAEANRKICIYLYTFIMCLRCLYWIQPHPLLPLLLTINQPYYL